MPNIILKKTFNVKGYRGANEKLFSIHGKTITTNMVENINRSLKSIEYLANANRVNFTMNDNRFLTTSHYFANMNTDCQKYNEEDVIASILDTMEMMGWSLKCKHAVESNSTNLTDDAYNARDFFIFHKPNPPRVIANAVKQSRSMDAGIAFQKQDNKVIISQNDGIFRHSGLKEGMEVLMINDVGIFEDFSDAALALNMIKNVVGRITIVALDNSIQNSMNSNNVLSSLQHNDNSINNINNSNDVGINNNIDNSNEINSSNNRNEPFANISKGYNDGFSTHSANEEEEKNEESYEEIIHIPEVVQFRSKIKEQAIKYISKIREPKGWEEDSTVVKGKEPEGKRKDDMAILNNNSNKMSNRLRQSMNSIREESEASSQMFLSDLTKFYPSFQIKNSKKIREPKVKRGDSTTVKGKEPKGKREDESIMNSTITSKGRDPSIRSSTTQKKNNPNKIETGNESTKGESSKKTKDLSKTKEGKPNKRQSSKKVRDVDGESQKGEKKRQSLVKKKSSRKNN